MIVGILRGFALGQTLRAIEAAMAGGLEHVEVTWNSPNAAEQIREAQTRFGSHCNIGAGTIISLADLAAALAAGAKFIVTPVLREAVVRECAARKVPVYPGAFSPSEIESAWSLGATMVKVFPAEIAGPNYIKALRGPFPQIKLMPTGGVDLQTLPAFIKAGASGFGIGSPLFDKTRIEAADWKWIEDRARSFCQAVLDHRQQSGSPL